VIMAEDAAWTGPLDARLKECLPEAGLEVLDTVSFSPSTTDFKPIFNNFEKQHPDVITAVLGHVGVQPTVQWAENQISIPMSGVNSQAISKDFWEATHGATDGVITYSPAAPNVALTSKTIPFAKAYKKQNGEFPAYTG